MEFINITSVIIDEYIITYKNNEVIITPVYLNNTNIAIPILSYGSKENDIEIINQLKKRNTSLFRLVKYVYNYKISYNYKMYGQPSPPKQDNKMLYAIILLVVLIIILLISIYYFYLKKPVIVIPPSAREIEARCDDLMKEHTNKTSDEDLLFFYEYCNEDRGAECKDLFLRRDTLNEENKRTLLGDCVRPYP